ncbi:acetoacetate--CoA ligase [Denitromonas ohlonensis]|uniref:Acetoacetate--CoA ligase n=2 Tax=Denitromonas TaxID=139331 RepID=A0A557S9M6_9RHOO|nr:acetoacetate--CoA ligase [Denitromonas ohlonensis]TVO63595.1 acetoacetate--CoA ligase [Denitromonas ohlonensis]TVO74129.1 acetoacetate--CoA ligase [Denitromonas ohlonensis]
MQASTAVWQPTTETIRKAQVTAFTNWLARERGLHFTDYDALWQWSVTEIDAFWRAVWDYFDIRALGEPDCALADARMPGAKWFPGVHLNYVEQVFRHATAAHPAIVFRNESGENRELSWAELQRQVAALAATLRGFGVRPGDRVCAFMPNLPETVVAFLAVASLGAVWSVCSPDMGKVAVVDRFSQIQPKVMIAVDGYRYGGKTHDRRPLISELLDALPSVDKLILLPTIDPTAAGAGFERGIDWADATAGDAPLQVAHVPFDHPLWVVYSSGTTGLPKPIVHGQGGVIIEHLKALNFHLDLDAGDRFHWFSATGWMMWNFQVGGLLLGCTICLFDGNPGYPDLNALWRFVGEAQVDFFGAGAAFFASCQKADIAPTQAANLERLRGLGSTGSPLSPETFRWLQDHVRDDLWINPICGGTDLVSAFIGGIPTLPVYSGEMQCRCLGARVEAFDDNAQPVIDAVGELVCTAPMPSMPLYFWNDTGNQRYHDSYFDSWPGVWRHGDWVQITPRGGAIIYGRSDATINRHGIRMGTSELYRAVEDLPEIMDSLVVDLEYLGKDSYLPLFLVLREGHSLTPALVTQIRERIKVALSARHVPNDIFQVPAIPRTLSGKKMELPMKKLLLGQPLEKIANPDTMANPDSLPWFQQFAAAYLAKQAPRAGRQAEDPAP